jgi:magnesium-transporting ATPase (P-type)
VFLILHLSLPNPCCLLQVDFLPFDPTIKRTEGTLKAADGRTFKCTKGAPHIILKLVEVDQEEVAKRVNWKVGQRYANTSLFLRPAQRSCVGHIVYRLVSG